MELQVRLDPLEEKYRKLDEVIEEYRGQQGILIQVLHRAQQIFGYLPREVQLYVAKALNIPFSEVSGVVSFYHYFHTQPAGKYTIDVCTGTACYVKGAQEVVDRIERLLKIKSGETTKDGKFTLRTARCMGACGLAPVMVVGKDIHGRVTPEKVTEILKNYN